MNRSSLFARLAWLAAAPFAAACGGDVYVESHRSTESSLACAVAPGEDVCARSFDAAIAPENRPTVVGVLAIAAEFAGIAREGRDEVARACEAIVDGLGATRPTSPPGGDDNARMAATCDAAVLAIGRVNRAAFSLALSPAGSSGCVDVPHPSCATKGASPSVDCPTVAVTLTMNPGASALDEADGALLQKNLARVAEFRTRLARLALLTEAIAANANTLVDAGSCAVSAINLMVNAEKEISASVALSARVSNAIAP